MLLTLFYFNYIQYLTFQCLIEWNELVKIVALWKRKCFITSSQATHFFHWLKQLWSVYTFIQAKLDHVTPYTIYNGIWTKTVGLIGVDCTIELSLTQTIILIDTWLHFIILQSTLPIQNLWLTWMRKIYGFLLNYLSDSFIRPWVDITFIMRCSVVQSRHGSFTLK